MSGSFSVFHGLPPLTFLPSAALRISPFSNVPREIPLKK